MMFSFLTRARRSRWSLPLAALAALILFVINEAAYRNASEALTGLGQRGVARVQIQTLLRRLIDSETAQRGYLLTGRQEYLEPYEQAVKDVDEALAWLGSYYGHADPKPGGLLKEIAARSHEKLSEVATTIERFNAGRTDAWRALLLSDIGREKMESIRKLSSSLIDIENERVVHDRGELFETLRLSRIGVNTMTAVSLLALFLFLRQTAAFDGMQRQVAQALQDERDRLEADVARRTADLTELARHLQTAREDERSHLARELHDELGALLTAAKLDAARLKRSLPNLPPEAEKRLQHLNETINDGIGLKRRIIEDLRPSSLSNLGLVAALDIQAREFEQRSEIKVVTELEPVPMSNSCEITAYRLVQESLTNIAKYAAATLVTVRLRRDGDWALISVQDNGRGFDVSAKRGSAQGLMGMRYRVESEGGRMHLDSAPGRGTVLEAHLPTLPEAPETTPESAPEP